MYTFSSRVSEMPNNFCIQLLFPSFSIHSRSNVWSFVKNSTISPETQNPEWAVKNDCLVFIMQCIVQVLYCSVYVPGTVRKEILVFQTKYTVYHKVRTYKEYHSVCPSSELGLSQPLSRLRVFPSPRNRGEGAH